ncbi:RNA polymerase sigma factor [Pedobacter sp. MC2016-24]|uniref:RNA polymerase sigma factor n=1 Tax=Pedobacter sp. MC2016-24 TaxID=2780090 RepID=UPI00188293E0|nr:sigma-70 family RNA polymerase sigma factor [Pedobacter sp. MC2016-24]MBE9601537.1 sigma-70 family RNA polymerase sigma factor [Pedobacter sp. MC2016-24]
MGSPDESRKTWNEFLKGDQQALLKLYQLYYVNLMNYGAKMTNNRDFTNDCLMDMLIDLWDRRESLPTVDNIRAYLTTCLRRTITGKYKHIKWQNSKHPDIALENQLFEAPYEDYLTSLQTNVNVTNIILKGLDKLTDRQKHLLRLKFFDNLNYDEIAEICGITKRTAYNIIHDSLKILKVYLIANKINPSSLDITFTLICVFLALEEVINHSRN